MRRLIWWVPATISVAIVFYMAMVPQHASLRETMSAMPPTASGPARIEIRAAHSEPMSQSVPHIVVLIPVLLSALPLLGRDNFSRRGLGFTGSSVLAAYCLVTSFSIGLLFVPSLLLMLTALLIDKPVQNGQLPREATS